MAITRWTPARELLSFQDEINRLFDGFVRPGVPGASGEERTWLPAADVRESGEDYFVRMDLPGVDRKEVKVSIFGDTLHVRGERRETRNQGKDSSWHRVERFHGQFERSFTLGAPVQADKVSATYRDGVLEIRIPKAESAKPREIPVQVGES